MLDSLEVAKLETLWKKRRNKIYLKNSAIVLCGICFVLAIFYASFGTSTATSTQIAQKSAKSLENSENSNASKNASKTDEKAEFSEFSEVLENSNNISENSNNISENSSSSENSISLEEMREQLKEEIKAEITQETIEREELQKEQERQLAELKQKARKELELERMNKVAREIDVGGYFAPNPNYQQNQDYSPNANYQQNYPQNYAPNQMPNQIINQAPNQYNGQNQYGGQNQNYALAPNAQKPSKGIVQISSSPAKPKTNNDNLEEIEENYKIHKEAKDALVLALNYYEKGDFDKAAKWAYELNSVDKNNPQGWILFAKSKYKSGNKADAIKVLEAYKPKASNQKEIQDLINQMKQNLSIK